MRRACKARDVKLSYAPGCGRVTHSNLVEEAVYLKIII